MEAATSANSETLAYEVAWAPTLSTAITQEALCTSLISTSSSLRVLFVDRRLGDAVHGSLCLVFGCHTHLDQEGESSGLVVVESVLRWSDHVVLPLAAWPLQSLHHLPYVVQRVDVPVVT